ncbi:MAG TPA: magnesium chelatase ATPase subunit I [Pyrinomonadaceae bacterium]|nr:magnesium chelatase ATPase subunit I [Pyrinomonadaceae bacterium]
MKRRPSSTPDTLSRRQARPVYPFTAIVGQEEMKLALLLNVIDPSIGGVLIMGHRGTGKSTAVRALADLLPLILKVRGCLYGCDPQETANLCDECTARLASSGKLPRERAPVEVVDLPLGATEDRVCGTINIERALTAGVKAFDPGLLARANRGFLYIDEVNLLEDHLIDLLLDVAVTGRNTVEREGISVEHPARFVLVGSGNPEEGELRPQLLDRFGLHVEVKTPDDIDQRVRVVERREAFERDPAGFRAVVEAEQQRLRRKLLRARKSFREVKLSGGLLRRIAELCAHLKIDGHRGELTITRAARALAAFEGRREVSEADVRRVAAMSLRHRLRRDPLEQSGSSARIEQAFERLFADETPTEEREAENRHDPDDRPPFNLGGGSGNNGAGEKEETGASSTRRRSSVEPRSAPPALDAQLPEDALDLLPRAPHMRTTRRQSARHRNDELHNYNNQRGRYARAVTAPAAGSKIALDATLRAAAWKAGVGGQGLGAGFSSLTPGPRPLTPIAVDALRFKRFKRKVGTLFIFAIDASGSMALNRINQATGALTHLLQQSYTKRDRVALISFRERRAELLLPPSQSVTRAKRILETLSLGGATPLAAALACSLEVAQRARRQGAQQIVLLLFTDGHANVSLHGEESLHGTARTRLIWQEIERLGAALVRAGLINVVVDTQNQFTSRGEGRALALKLDGRYIYLPHATADGERFSALI